MSSRVLVLDANILIRAVLGEKVRNHLIRHNEDVDFFGSGIPTWTTNNIHIFFEK